MEVHGLAALVWARFQGDPLLEIDLEGTKLSPECLAVLGRSMGPSIGALGLRKTDFAKGGNDLSGLRVLCSALSDAQCAGLLSLDLSHNNLRADAANLLAEGMRKNASVTSIDLRGNKLGVEGWTTIFNTLCDSPASKISTWDLSREFLGPEIAKPLANYISVTASLTSVRHAIDIF